ncbi:MAG: DNA repair protein [Nitrosospira sp.]|nr:DNA repair protein [Nitrosospira sp.]
MSVRKKMVLRWVCLGIAVAFLAGSGSPGIVAASAAATKDQKRERQALRRMQQQLNEAQQQKSALDEEKAVLEETLKKTQGETETQKRSAASAAAKASRLAKDIEAANTEKTELRTQLDEAGKRNEELASQSRQLEQDLKDTAVALEKQNEQRKLCEANNAELYRIGRELVDWYTSKGPVNAMLEAEPFTGMKRVEMENLLENYRDKLEGQRLEPSIK